MQHDGDIVPEAAARPHSLVGLLALYESNFLRLSQLIPELRLIDGCFCSAVAGDFDLRMQVLDRSRYTVTASFVYELAPGVSAANPEIIVRAYLDGNLAEALSVDDGGFRLPGANISSKQHAHLMDRWQRNMILNKWLEYLTDSGHLILQH